MSPLTQLPIDDLIPRLRAALVASPNAVVVAAPGAGKTTRVPPALVSEPWMGDGAIVMLQPRRVAARASANRIASEQRWTIGQEVGWHIRFEKKIGPRTKVRVLTEGILLRQLQADPFLEGVSCVILDEFHERSLYTDVAIALLREIQTSVRPDLRIIVMSATIDPTPIARFLGDCAVLESAGRMFPIEISHRPRALGAPLPPAAADAIREAWAQAGEGHLLAFLPGMGEIRAVENLLRGWLPQNASLHVLHSSVPGPEQDRALAPSDLRKIILATNIAETSITIDGVRAVIDSGLERVMEQDPVLGIDRLELRRISRASMRQRTGRAGRTGPGRCIRLWAAIDEEAMDEYPTPELHRVDLAGTVLSLYDFGVRNINQFRWYDPPQPERLKAADLLLWELCAFEYPMRLTALGQQIARLPVHPRLGILLVEGARRGLLREAAAMAAVVSEKDIYQSIRTRDRKPGWIGRSDVVDRAEVLLGDGEGSQAIDRAALASARRTMQALVDSAAGIDAGGARWKGSQEEAMMRLLLRAYADRLTRRREGDPTRGGMIGGRGIVLEGTSVVRDAPLFLALDPRESENATESRVSLASAVEAEWIREDFASRVEKSIVSTWDDERLRVTVQREFRFIGLLISTVGISVRDEPETATKAFFEFIMARWDRWVRNDEDLAGLLARMEFLARHMPELGFGVVSDLQIRDWLRPALHGMTMMQEVRERGGLATLLKQALDWKLQQALDREAPTHMEVPTGSRIRLDYTQGAQPVLAVRLQELFGLAETPSVAAGRVPVLLHLLSPNHRPVQVTTDLRSFWNNTYAEVRKELRARYPKHSWPDDPWNAPPVRGARRRQPES